MKRTHATRRRSTTRTRKPTTLLAVERLEDRTLLSRHAILDADFGHNLHEECTLATAPEILDARVSAPDPSTLLSHGSIHYTTGEVLDVALTMQGCIDVSDIFVGSVSVVDLEREQDPIDGVRNYYDLLSDEPLSGDLHRATYRLYFSNDGDGASTPVRFEAQNSLYRASLHDTGIIGIHVPTAEYEFTLAYVQAIRANPQIGAGPVISISEAELRNSIIQGIFDEFAGGGDGRLYDPDYDIELRVGHGFSLFPPFDQPTDTIQFGFDVKVDLPDGDILYICNPTAHVEGAFRLAADDRGRIQVNWADGPDVGLDFPGFFDAGVPCEEAVSALLGLGFRPVVKEIVIGLLDHFLDELVTLFFSDTIEAELQAAITEYVSELDCGGFACSGFIAEGDLEIRPHELRVPLDLDFPSVTFAVPYNIDRIAQPYSTGLALNAGEQVVVTAEGLVDVCETNIALPETCTTIPVGPAGLFNTHDLPAPFDVLDDPSSDDPSSGAVYLDRIQAANAFTTLTRTRFDLGCPLVAPLPLPDENVAALTSRVAYSPLNTGLQRAVGLARVINVAAGSPGRLAFGNNDIGEPTDIYSCEFGRTTTYSRDLYRITVSWLIERTARTSINNATRELTVFLGDAGDDVGIAGTDTGVVVTVNGADSFYPDFQVRTIRLLAGAGDDTVRVTNLPTDLRLTIQGGDGIDTLLGSFADKNFVVAEDFESGCPAIVYTVTNTADIGRGSLRGAILAANANCGVDTIEFNLPGVGVQTIQPSSPLPTITDPVTIDGYTQPGAAPNTLAESDNAVLRIELDGSLAGEANGLHVTAGSTTIRGLAINRFALAGVLLEGAGRNVVQGNFIGADVTGHMALGNGFGVFILGSSANQIGGTASRHRNIISGNGDGIDIDLRPGDVSGTMIQGNYIGAHADGTAGLGNIAVGVRMYAIDVTIGGEKTGAGNVIVSNQTGIALSGSGNVIQGNHIGGNTYDGVFFSAVGQDATDNLVADNTIQGSTHGIEINGAAGTDNVIRGNRILFNAVAGVYLWNGTSHNIIGGDTLGLRDPSNLISGNGTGVVITGVGTDDNVVAGNYIGTNPAGTAALGNLAAGVRIQDGARRNIVGGTGLLARNLISGNGGNGVEIIGALTETNFVRGNYIGTDADGMGALGNRANGVLIDNAARNYVGTPARWNVISGNLHNGVEIRGSAARENGVQGNFIGTDVTGTARLPNGGSGVLIDDAPGNYIAGLALGSDTEIQNVISGNGEYGVVIRGPLAAFNRVGGGSGINPAQSNYIGANVNGFGVLGNVLGGVLLWAGAHDNFVDNNLINGNLSHGVLIYGSATHGNQVSGNWIGMSHWLGAPTGGHGVLIVDAPGNTVGSEVSSGGNVIYNNRLSGVQISGSTATANRVLNNSIRFNHFSGVAVTNGAHDNQIGDVIESGIRHPAGNVISGNIGNGVTLGTGTSGNRVQANSIRNNEGAGVHIDGSNDNLIGGLMADEGNIIMFDDGSIIVNTGKEGVLVESGVGNAVLSNSICDNHGLGIELRSNFDRPGVTLNDGYDADTGANNLQNFPLITFAKTTGAAIQVRGVLNSVPNRTFTVQIFGVADCDASGYGEGRYLLGTLTRTTNNGGTTGIFEMTVGGPVSSGSFITATATLMVDHDGNPATPLVPRDTSEFSACKKITGNAVLPNPAVAAFADVLFSSIGGFTDFDAHDTALLGVVTKPTRTDQTNHQRIDELTRGSARRLRFAVSARPTNRLSTPAIFSALHRDHPRGQKRQTCPEPFLPIAVSRGGRGGSPCAAWRVSCPVCKLASSG